MNPTNHSRTCVGPDARFKVGVHAPHFTVNNLRAQDHITALGHLNDGSPVENQINFPPGDVQEPRADLIYEIPNAFPFRGTSFINTAWADAKAKEPESIRLPAPQPCSLSQTLDQIKDKPWDKDEKKQLITHLPAPLKRALAQASTDPEELVTLAQACCDLTLDPSGEIPLGMAHEKTESGHARPIIKEQDIFEILVNNPHLPDSYKEAMVLRPGIQGKSEITGDYKSQDTHVFEYLRRNSYIPWGHFAANMANDEIRYKASELSLQDMRGIRHLYYQRIYARMARELSIPLPGSRRPLTPEELESLRLKITQAMAQGAVPRFNAALWGWNYGFGAAQSGHRLHASHQMIHQQNALVPRRVDTQDGQDMATFSMGDLVYDFATAFEQSHGQPFFETYKRAIWNNVRTDGKPGESSLIIYEDGDTMLFVPKAQVCEYELQLMAPCPHVLAADTAMRDRLDAGILAAIKILDHLGAQMVTAIEMGGRFDQDKGGQHIVYSFIPRLPYAPPTFCEAQLRWICGCYPEDFARACRRAHGQQASH